MKSNNVITLEDFENGTRGNGKKEKESPSAQLEFSYEMMLSTTPMYASDLGSIYCWTGAYWKAMSSEEVERLAVEWLAIHRPNKCSEKTAASCVATAALRLKPLVKRKDNGILYVPCQNGTLKIEREGMSLIDGTRNVLWSAILRARLV